MKTQIKDIEIVFAKDQQQIIDKIIMMIQNNYELILGCLGENRTIDISQDESNFNNTFYFIVDKTFNNPDIKQSLNDTDFLSALHIEALIRKKKISNTTIVEQIPNMSDELLSTLIAYKYFDANEKFENFVEYLKYRNKEDEIFKWFQKVSRWDTYNFLLNLTVNFFKTDDEDFFKQMGYIISIWFYRVIGKAQNDNFSNKEYQKISEKEFDTLFYEFLNYINAPVEWTNIYNELKEKGLIIVEKEKEYDNSMCFVDKDGVLKILIGNGDNLVGFCNFVHEFIHYVARQSGCLSIGKISTSEFPSIFFEKIAAEFLKEKGYSSQIVDQTTNYRESNNYSLITSMQSLLSDLIRYINYGKITKNDKISFYKNQIDLINNTRKELLKTITDAGVQVEGLSALDEIKIDIEKSVDDDCDLMIDEFIKEGLLVMNGYQYLLDSYLVEQVLNKRMDDNTIVEKMINVTNNLKITSVKDILTIFGIENALQKEAIEKLIKK